MSNTTAITTQSNTASNSLTAVINAYLDTVRTAKGTRPTEEQKKNFLLECLANGLNPIKKQAYLIGYDSASGPSFSTVVSINGITSIASRTGEYAGLDQTRFRYNGDKIESCSVTVYRLVKGQRCAFTGSAYFSERVQTGGQWQKQPMTMLEKCARAAALRSAFPEELGSLYDEAEMPPVQNVVVQAETQAEKLQKYVAALTNADKPKFFEKLAEIYNVESLDELNDEQRTELIAKFQANIKK